MRLWPFKRPERRNYTSQIISALEAAASSQAATVGHTAAVEAVSGLLARTLISAEVTAPEWARKAITPTWLATVARELVRHGEHLSLLGMGSRRHTEFTARRLLGLARRAYRIGMDGAGKSVYGPDGNINRTVGARRNIFHSMGAAVV